MEKHSYAKSSFSAVQTLSAKNAYRFALRIYSPRRVCFRKIGAIHILGVYGTVFSRSVSPFWCELRLFSC